MNIADRLAYDQPRVVAQTQFVFRDVRPVARYRGRRSRLAQYWATWQSGIEFANGRQKPAFTAYAMPLDIYPVSGPTSDGGRDVRAWGQLRFLPPGQNGQLQSLGVDTIRVFVPWSSIAPAPDSTVAPAGFDAANPAAYPAGGWQPFDELVRSASARGLSVILTPTAPIPAWASRCGGSVSNRQSCRPDPAQFGAFMQALGSRYSGAGEPRVTRWGLWNEPNVGRWLTPQFVRRGGRVVPASPAIYRGMAYAAIAGLAASGHGGDQILLGETGPIGHTTGPLARRPVATAEFWRDLLCIGASGRRLGGRAASEQGCRGARRLNATAIAHHPYIQGGSRSPLTPARPDEITISSISRLKRILGQAAAQGMLRRGLPLYYTEYGFQTNPPDRILGVSLARQAAYLDESEWIAFRDPAVRG